MLDVLTAQCDRHSENVFIDKAGRLQVGVWARETGGTDMHAVAHF